VEQDLVLSRAVVELFRHPLLADSMAFRGGTALHKLFLAKPGRYSEDIDLVQLDAGPIGSLLDAVRRVLDPWLGEPKRKRSHGGATLLYRFETTARPVQRRRLKVEVNTREHVAVLGSFWIVAAPRFRAPSSRRTSPPSSGRGSSLPTCNRSSPWT
jgi:predicted nucleotidyltransferase component of viral defense system